MEEETRITTTTTPTTTTKTMTTDKNDSQSITTSSNNDKTPSNCGINPQSINQITDNAVITTTIDERSTIPSNNIAQLDQSIPLKQPPVAQLPIAMLNSYSTELNAHQEMLEFINLSNDQYFLQIRDQFKQSALLFQQFSQQQLLLHQQQLQFNQTIANIADITQQQFKMEVFRSKFSHPFSILEANTLATAINTSNNYENDDKLISSLPIGTKTDQYNNVVVYDINNNNNNNNINNNNNNNNNDTNNNNINNNNNNKNNKNENFHSILNDLDLSLITPDELIQLQELHDLVNFARLHNQSVEDSFLCNNKANQDNISRNDGDNNKIVNTNDDAIDNNHEPKNNDINNTNNGINELSITHNTSNNNNHFQTTQQQQSSLQAKRALEYDEYSPDLSIYPTLLSKEKDDENSMNATTLLLNKKQRIEQGSDGSILASVSLLDVDILPMQTKYALEFNSEE